MRANPCIPEAVRAVIDRLREILDQEALSHAVRLNVVSAVRQAIIPKRKPGRKNPNIDSAWQDYQRGLHGVNLYKRHIPGLSTMNQYHRAAEQNRLVDGLRKRARRFQEQAGRRTTEALDTSIALRAKPESGQ